MFNISFGRCIENSPQSGKEPRLPDLVFTHDPHLPRLCAGRGKVLPIVFAVAPLLRQPVLGVGLRLARAARAVVAAPAGRRFRCCYMRVAALTNARTHTEESTACFGILAMLETAPTTAALLKPP